MVMYEAQLIPAGFPKQGKQRHRVVKRLEKDQAYFKWVFSTNILAPRAIQIGGLVIILEPFPADTHAHMASLALC